MLELVQTTEQLLSTLANWREQGYTIGFVPTMGYLHAGHQSLIARARAENDRVVVSDFLNPIQFGPAEDLSKYPRDLAKDQQAIEQVGADVLFYPSAKQMYGDNFSSGNLTMVVPPTELTNKLCGAKRPGHFAGVCTIVNKLFNLVRPDVAYFGQKDAQQLVIIQRMVQDMNCSVRIVGCPIIREPDGLAMSSRNIYLNVHERQAALVLSQALDLAQKLVGQGEVGANVIIEKVTKYIMTEPLAQIDYVNVVDTQNFQDIAQIDANALLALAVFIGEDIHRTRLIDNVILRLA